MLCRKRGAEWPGGSRAHSGAACQLSHAAQLTDTKGEGGRSRGGYDVHKVTKSILQLEGYARMSLRDVTM